jgi:hypothetical protein
VQSGSTKATASGQSHALPLSTILIHANALKSPRSGPFAAIGAGVEILSRHRAQSLSFQPLSNLVVLDPHHEARPLISVGGGIKIAAGKRALIRLTSETI